MRSNKLPVVSAIKYGVFAFVFILGYQSAEKNIQPYIAIAGWVLGFILGLKLRLKYADRS